MNQIQQFSRISYTILGYQIVNTDSILRNLNPSKNQKTIGKYWWKHVCKVAPDLLKYPKLYGNSTLLSTNPRSIVQTQVLLVSMSSRAIFDISNLSPNKPHKGQSVMFSNFDMGQNVSFSYNYLRY